MPLEQSYVNRHEKSCQKQHLKVSDTKKRIDVLKASIDDLGVIDKQKKRYSNELNRRNKSLPSFQKLANQDCDKLAEATERRTSVKDKCQAKS